MDDKCPGQDRRNLNPESIIDIKCFSCGEMVELWPPAYKAKCPKCGNWVEKKSIPSCADWCPGGKSTVKECLGDERYNEWKKSRAENEQPEGGEK